MGFIKGPQLYLSGEYKIADSQSAEVAKLCYLRNIVYRSRQRIRIHVHNVIDATAFCNILALSFYWKLNLIVHYSIIFILLHNPLYC